MDTVMLDGVEYLKASVAAKRFRYTADYIGQLCRGRKIDARLVGRTWFVNVASLEEHKEGRYQNLKSTKQNGEKVEQRFSGDSDTSSKIKPLRVQVPSPSKSNFFSEALQERRMDTAHRERSLRVSYEPDEGHLIPHIEKHHTPLPRTLRIDPADAKILSIKKEHERPVSLVAEELPEVSLSGTLTIKSFEDISTRDEGSTRNESFENTGDEKTLENKVISDDVSDEAVSNQDLEDEKSQKAKGVQKRTVKILTKRPVRNTPVETFKKVTPAHLSDHNKKMSEVSQNVGSAVSSFVPESVRQASPEKTISPVISYAPLLATMLSILVVMLLLSMSTTIVFSDDGYRSQLVIQAANLLEIFTQ